MIKPGIRARVFWLAILPVFLTSSALLIYLTVAKIRDLEDSLADRGAAIIRHLAPSVEYGVISGNAEILYPLVESAAKEPDVRGVVIYNNAGHILMKSGTSDWQNMPQPIVEVNGLIRFDREKSLIYLAPIIRTEVALDEIGLLDHSSPSVEQHKAGWVGLELSRAGLLIGQKQIVLQSVSILFVGLVMSALLGWRLGRRITQPILSLAHSVERIGEGHLTERVPSTSSSDEFGVLQRGVNHMASSLQAAHEQMQERIDQATARLVYQANHDALTGLVNRNEFEHRLNKAIATARQHGRTHALCYMDLDQFKVINDTCGHAAGDELLRQIAMMLKDLLRERDTLARLGGDEFALLLENCDMKDAEHVSEACRNMVRQYRFKWENRLFNIGVSIGLVIIDQTSGSMADLLSAADAACYVAKNLGRNQVHIYQSADSELAKHRGEMQWVERIHKALDENRLRLYWQEIRQVHDTQQRECYFEILLRMVDEDGRVILPMAFIPAAERYSLMPKLDRWAVENTVKLCGRSFAGRFFYPNNKNCVFSVNLSGVSLKDREFRSWLRTTLSENPGLGQVLCFEITETAAIGDLVTINNFITDLRQFGCRFALDDFGSGLSSFSYLKNLQVDFLKIDGAFVHEMAQNTLDYSMVEAIHYISRKVGLKTVAEFVESEAILNCLRSIGIDYAQGDYLHKPEPIATLLIKLQESAMLSQ